MTYDAENRPLSVTLAGKTTCYVYGAGGARLKKIENLAAGTDCKAISPTAPVTLYFGAVEVRNFRLAGLEQILTYPQPSVKLLNGVLPANASYLHRDAQGSVRQITSAAGVSDQRRFYLPYGAVSLSTVALTNPAPDTKGWIGERLDADAGLQYLNARYYDPQLGMFLQPDWWEVMQPGVGTNRYSYSFGDPVNGIDPSGHQSVNQSSSDPFRFLINLFSMGSGRTAAQTASDLEQKTRQGMQNVVKGYAYRTLAVGAGAVGVQATVTCFSSQVVPLQQL